MGSQEPASLMYEILKLCEEINSVASKLNRDKKGVFKDISFRKPKFLPAELGFLRMVSWLYVLYYEAGEVNVEFLTERLATFGLDSEGKLYMHRIIVNKLRTFLQHNLDPSKARNIQIQEDCERWLKTHCKTSVPEEDNHWNDCLIGIQSEAIVFLKALRFCIRCIEKDDSCVQIVSQWDFRRERFHPVHEFDRLITQVSIDIGRENIDPVRIRKRFYDKWRMELELLQGIYNFEVEARKLIEYVLLFETTPILPITGEDIMREFSIEPGQKVGELLKRARLLYDSEACSSKVLLEKLRLEFDNH